MSTMPQQSRKEEITLSEEQVREAIIASWNNGFPYCSGITGDQIQFITKRLNALLRSKVARDERTERNLDDLERGGNPA